MAQRTADRGVGGRPDASGPTVSALWEQVLPDVTRTCRARMPQFPDPAHSAEDAVQEVALALLPAAARHDPERGTWPAYAQGVTRHKIGDAYRSWYRTRPIPLEDAGDRVDEGPGPEELVLRAEQAAGVRKLLALLSERQRQILVMRVGLGIPAAEVSAALGMSPTAVRVAQHRALNRLRVELAGRDEDES